MLTLRLAKKTPLADFSYDDTPINEFLTKSQNPTNQGCANFCVQLYEDFA